MNGRTGTWTEDEDTKLQDDVKNIGDKDWAAISALLINCLPPSCSTQSASSTNSSTSVSSVASAFANLKTSKRPPRGRMPTDRESLENLKQYLLAMVIMGIEPRRGQWANR